MNIKSLLFLGIKSVLFGVFVLVVEYGLSAISWELEESGHESLANLIGLFDSFLLSPGEPFAFQPVAINIAIFVFWTVAYFAFGLAQPAIKRHLENSRRS